jgi:pimeloyl-ACP methyl ester carboxylesterase
MPMPFFPRLADRLVLCPSRGRIDVPHKTRRTIVAGGHEIEIWIEQSIPGGVTTSPELFVLKFNGAGGRAERATAHPFDFWADLPGEVWSPNPPGFGGSEGPPSLKWLAAVGRDVFEAVRAEAAGRPIVISGNSLGTATALHVAAAFADEASLVGLILRNPPPLSHLIARKFGMRSLGLSLLVARQIPPELDSIANAAQCRVPAVFLCSGRDRIVPPWSQKLVIDAYAGEKRVVGVPDADHVFEFQQAELEEYGRALGWLRERIGMKKAEFRMQNSESAS